MDLADPPQWPNKHLLSQWVGDKRKASETTPHLQALVDHVIALCKASLATCYCAKEFILQQISHSAHDRAHSLEIRPAILQMVNFFLDLVFVLSPTYCSGHLLAPDSFVQ
jgi:hypothetical protein